MTPRKTALRPLAARAPITIAALLLAGGAEAQVAAPPTGALAAWRTPSPDPAMGATPVIDLAAPRTSLTMSYAQTVALREAGVARTSVDHRFDRESLVGSVGFLCGLQPRLDESSGSAFGLDPHGRFLGAKLSRAF